MENLPAHHARWRLILVPIKRIDSDGDSKPYLPPQTYVSVVYFSCEMCTAVLFPHLSQTQLGDSYLGSSRIQTETVQNLWEWTALWLTVWLKWWVEMSSFPEIDENIQCCVLINNNNNNKRLIFVAPACFGWSSNSDELCIFHYHSVVIFSTLMTDGPMRNRC